MAEILVVVVGTMIYNIVNKKLMVLLGSYTMKRVLAIISIILINVFFTSNFSMAKLTFNQEEIAEEAVEENSILFMVDNPYAFVEEEFQLIDPNNTQVESIIINGRTLIPLRFFAEKFGFEVEWNENEHMATMVKDDIEICLKPDSDVININGMNTQMNSKPLIIQNRLFVPLRDINERFGKKVSYRKGIVSVTDGDTSIEEYSDNEFIETYYNFVRCKVIMDHSIKPITKYEAATYFVNHILSYYNKSVPDLDLYYFPDNKDIPEEAYYHCNLAAYLNLVKVEKGDFEPFKELSDIEINEALLRLKEILINQPDLDFVTTKEIKTDLLSLIKEKAGSKSYRIRVSVYDFADETSVSYNGQERFYPASLTKVANLLCFFEEVQKGNFSLDNTYKLKQSDKYINGNKVVGTGDLQYKSNGSKYTYSEILSKMVSLSDNIAANIIFDALGREKLDSFLERYGLNDTKIYKKYYDGNRALPTNYSTTDDLNKMLVLLENRIALGDNLSAQGIEYMKKTVNKDRIALYAPEDVVIANKIGYVSRLSGDMALVYYPDREPIALTIVAEGINGRGINQEDASKLIGTISREIINYYRIETGPSLYVDGELVQERIGFRFIGNRPYIKEHSSLEGYLKEDKMLGNGKYISLDSLVMDNECMYSLREYPQKSVSITNEGNQ